MVFVTVAQLMGHTLLLPINVFGVAHKEAAAGFVDRAALVVAFHAGIIRASRVASKDVFGNQPCG